MHTLKENNTFHRNMCSRFPTLWTDLILMIGYLIFQFNSDSRIQKRNTEYVFVFGESTWPRMVVV